MAPRARPHLFQASVAMSACLVLAACDDGLDLDMRGLSNGFDTTDATFAGSAPPPTPDSRGVISYPTYQVAVAQRGDTVADVAARVGTDAVTLARFNGIPADVALRQGEILALPERVPEATVIAAAPLVTTTTTPAAPGGVDITTLATGALDRAGPGATTTAAVSPPAAQSGPEPIRHRVMRGETSFSIARLYDVSVRSLADWNGLGSDLEVREGQFLLIPVAVAAPAPRPEDTTPPGAGSPTPTPPSASQPLPDANETQDTAVAAPPSPNLVEDQTEASDNARLLYPVNGRIIRGYEAGQNEGIDIGAAAGTSVRAADAGTVAAITRDTDQVPIIVVRHAGNLLTVYANVDDIAVEKGDRVSRGQDIATIRDGSPAFLHFEVREGFESVDPVPFLN